ncbi:hypothetical protein Scep_028602 [Stephania cephalantha]|uniref:ubiquitinyl hydrolase 1 n=1 Tax=Stephania cephalantha TaxID=152367 RepID=A0AAP0HNL0_9MAGN
MDLLRSHLSRVRIPEPTNRVYKQECCISFDNPVLFLRFRSILLILLCVRQCGGVCSSVALDLVFQRSEGGLFIDMNSFLAFGKDYVVWNYEKSGNPVYLHVKQTRKSVPEDRPLKKPTLLAIGIEGGFDNNEPEYEETHSIIILPDFVSLPFPSVELPEKVRLAVDSILMSEGAERKEQIASWTADKKQISAYAMNLQQTDNGINVPPSGWKCCKCEKTENLWLNLTDGMILCGRRNWDSSGGNNHAMEHYNETNYPLAVKLGTITADLDKADVFSYPEDESVEDPLLAQHLAFFGIDFSSLQKTEMTTAEKELDQNTNFDWNRIQENGKEGEPLFGPGYTGLVNLGNRYYKSQSLKQAFENAPADPTLDLNTQLYLYHSVGLCAMSLSSSLLFAIDFISASVFFDRTKLGHGLLSGKYSVPAQEIAIAPDSAVATLDEVVNPGLLKTSSEVKQEGIPPRMFKAVIAASHHEFSTMRQQDALEFYQHFIDQVERANAGSAAADPTRSFKFGIEERIQCSSGKVAYNRRVENVLPLNIPLHEATNKEQLKGFHKLKGEKGVKGEEVSADEIVRPRVPLEACLANFSAPDELDDFYSTALNDKTTASKRAGLTSFPDYLVLQMKKFVLEEGWVPKKLDVYIDVPDIIDISHMRSNGLQPGEELLPEAVPDTSQTDDFHCMRDLILNETMGVLLMKNQSVFSGEFGL